MNANWTEAEVAAFLEGRLAGADADRVAAALETDPAAQAAAERAAGAGAATDALLREAYAAPLGEPAPRAMLDAVRGSAGRVVPFERRRPRPTWAPAALAASVALVAGLAGGLALTGRGPSPVETAALGLGAATGAAAAALEGAPTGTEGGGLRLAGSFRDAAGRPCREFDALDAAGDALGHGVACRDADAWRVVALAAATDGAAGGEGYAPASGTEADPLAAALRALGAGPALSPAEEADAIGRGWR
jgi:hypothetical protein